MFLLVLFLRIMLPPHNILYLHLVVIQKWVYNICEQEVVLLEESAVTAAGAALVGPRYASTDQAPI